MDLYSDIKEIPEETVAAWIDGNLSPENDAEFLDLLSQNEELAEILDSYDDVEISFENIVTEGFEIPEELDADFVLPSIDAGYFIEGDYDVMDPELDLASIDDDDVSIDYGSTSDNSDDIENTDVSDDSFDNYLPEDFDIF